jgi:hypothetical protein
VPTNSPRATRQDDEQRWRLPTDPEPAQARPPQIAVVPYAIAAGLLATLIGGLASLAVPGRWFLLVWAAVSLTAALGAGCMADRIYAALLHLLARLLARARRPSVRGDGRIAPARRRLRRAARRAIRLGPGRAGPPEAQRRVDGP